ncbi:hypothetical protein MMC07_007398 [Pseudocyphellaria aurata]|nr:hypothetical protein [Pseudocyphellaria aurata]
MADNVQPSAAGTPLGNAIEDDSDWEYEYHETETETFYVTVDLSSASSTMRTREKRDPSNFTTAESPPVEEFIESGASPIRGPALDPSEAVQILDFHTSNPLISYQGRLYSCEWSTTIGTDLLLTQSDSSEADVLAATRIKLSGRPVRMIRHHGNSKASLQPLDEAVETQQATVESVPPQINSPASPKSAAKPPVLEIPLDKHASVARQNQVHFLERFAAIKAERGEHDEVTVYAKKRYTGTGWRSRQRVEGGMEYDDEGEGGDTMANGEGDDDEDPDGDGEGRTQSAGATRLRSIQAATSLSRAARQKKSRPRGRGPRNVAGLFRDYRPNAGNKKRAGLFQKSRPADGTPAPVSNDSDSRAAISVPTPQTWDQLAAPSRESGGGVVAEEPERTMGSGPPAATVTGEETGDVIMEDVT